MYTMFKFRAVTSFVVFFFFSGFNAERGRGVSPLNMVYFVVGGGFKD